MPHEPLSSIVYEYILDQLFNQDLRPGQKISEAALSAALNMSRTPIREALRELAADGIVEILPQRFARIAVLTEKDLHDMRTFKIHLEALTCQLVLLKVSNEDIYKLIEINDGLAKALAESNLLEALRWDVKFHDYYNDITDNPYLIEAQSKIRGKNLLYQSETLKDKPSLLNNSIKQHEQLIDALFKRDYDLLLHVSLTHLANFYKSDTDVYCTLYQDFSNGYEDMSKRGEKVYCSNLQKGG